MSQPLISSSLAVLVDNFMNNIADLKIQADLLEGKNARAKSKCKNYFNLKITADDGTLFEDKLVILEDVIANLENEMRKPKRYTEQLEKNILLAQVSVQIHFYSY